MKLLFTLYALAAVATATDQVCINAQDYRCLSSGDEYCLDGSVVMCESSQLCFNSAKQLECRETPCKPMQEVKQNVLGDFVKELFSLTIPAQTPFQFPSRLRSSSGDRCRQRDFECKDVDGFCLDNRYLHCAPGTHCANSIVQKTCGWSPCVDDLDVGKTH